MASKKDMEEIIACLRLEATNNHYAFQKIQTELEYQKINSKGWMDRYHTELDKRCLLESFILNCIYTETSLKPNG